MLHSKAQIAAIDNVAAKNSTLMKQTVKLEWTSSKATIAKWNFDLTNASMHSLRVRMWVDFVVEFGLNRRRGRKEK
jgi:hypothetical protein